MIDGARQFKLKNADGQFYDMTRPDAFIWNPKGLGWGHETETERLGMTYYIVQNNEVQPNPSGDMVFRTYDEYHNFLKFCYVGGLVLYYSPHYVSLDKKWFCLDVEIRIDKSEIEYENEHLICPVEFIGTSYWYRTDTYETLGVSELGGKKYTYTYGYRYGFGQSNIIHISNELASYFKLTINGAITNPCYSVYVNGKEIRKGKINVAVESTQKLVVNTVPDKMEIALYDKMTDERIENIYQKSDFSTLRIFALPRGECSFVITSDDSVAIFDATLEVMSHV